jgi:predicted Zn finger-like uncharacterized protein
MAQKVEMMFTQCPECQTTQSLTLKQLRGTRGMIKCRHCSVLFDALERISETGTIASENNAADSTLPWDQEKRSKSGYWGLGVCVCALLLTAQIMYFEGYALTQNASIRPILVALCNQITCRLPDYKNPDKFNIVGSFNPTPDHNYEFHAAISNQAALSQAYPNVRLTLLAFSGKPFAARIFQPQDYLPEVLRASFMKPDATTEISLKIAAPKSAIGGTFFEIVD